MVAALDMLHRWTLAARFRPRERMHLQNGEPMFWKTIALLLVLWAVGMYTSFTLGGLIHLLPVLVVAVVVVRIMGKRPNSEFGRWRPASERHLRR